MMRSWLDRLLTKSSLRLNLVRRSGLYTSGSNRLVSGVWVTSYSMSQYWIWVISHSHQVRISHLLSYNMSHLTMSHPYEQRVGMNCKSRIMSHKSRIKFVTINLVFLILHSDSNNIYLCDNSVSNIDNSVSDINNSVSDIENSVSDIKSSMSDIDNSMSDIDNSMSDESDHRNLTSVLYLHFLRATSPGVCNLDYICLQPVLLWAWWVLATNSSTQSTDELLSRSNDAIQYFIHKLVWRRLNAYPWSMVCGPTGYWISLCWNKQADMLQSGADVL